MQSSLSFAVDATSGRVVFGAGARSRLSAELLRAGARRVLIVTTPGRVAAAEELAAQLGTLAAGVHAEARQHVPREAVQQAQLVVQRRDADWVVALGGGSAIGLCKALALEQTLRIAAIPSTYSGSEMTDLYGITESGAKRTARDERARPALVIYDPELSAGLPVMTSVTSAFNAMAHCVEALYAPDLDPVSAWAAEEGLRLLATSIAGIASAPGDLSARTDALCGAYLAGLSLRAGVGLHHKLCHVLGGSFALPHAETHTVLLPHVLAFNAPSAPLALIRMRRALAAASAVTALHGLARTLGAPTDLAALGLSHEDLDRAVDLASSASVANPRPYNRPALRNLLEDAYYGKAPTPEDQ